MAISVELSRGEIMKTLVNNGKEFGLEPEKSWEPVKNFRQDVNTEVPGELVKTRIARPHHPDFL